MVQMPLSDNHLKKTVYQESNCHCTVRSCDCVVCICYRYLYLYATDTAIGYKTNLDLSRMTQNIYHRKGCTTRRNTPQILGLKRWCGFYSRTSFLRDYFGRFSQRNSPFETISLCFHPTITCIIQSRNS